MIPYSLIKHNDASATPTFGPYIQPFTVRSALTTGVYKLTNFD